MSWREKAKCLGMDSEIFFLPRGRPNAEAKQICDDCPVQMECLDFAVERNEKYGIWGGVVPRDRRRIRRRLGLSGEYWNYQPGGLSRDR